ncbi:MAG TPA: nitrilase-related carbon-nitrogen hydrolase [Verrucomicrobiae bacterium]|nr:nitrilase-related carbon-nitrogen hydrolase [Verrucomicrobiae bacterium]
MKIALAQIAPRLGDPDANLSRHLAIAARARGKGADLVVFPELSLTGYLLQDLVPEVAEEVSRGARLRKLAAASRGISIVAGFVERGAGLLHYNAAGCFVDGAIAHVHRKVYLPTYGMFDEGRHFAAGESFQTFSAPWGRTGLLVCEDFWHLSSPYLLSLQGMEALIVISAGPAKGVDGSKDLRSGTTWVELGRVVARHLSAWVVYVNRAGYEEGWAFQGGSFVCSPAGDVVASAKLLAEDLVVATLRPADLRKARLAAPLMRDEKIDLVRRELERVTAERSAPAAARAPVPRRSGAGRR